MANRFLLVVILMSLFSSCFYEENKHLKMGYDPEDSVVSLNDKEFNILNVQIIDNYGKILYKSETINKSSFKIFSDITTKERLKMLTTIKKNDSKKMQLFFQVKKKDVADSDIAFTSLSFNRMDSIIIIRKAKRP